MPNKDSIQRRRDARNCKGQLHNRHLALVQVAVVIALLLNHLPAHAQTPAPLSPTVPASMIDPLPRAAEMDLPSASRYTVGQCTDADRDTLRSEIQSAALAVIDDSTGTLDIDALVERKWRELNVDAVVDAEVARAVEQVAAEEGYWSRLLSGWSAGRAEEFAQRISQDAFTSEVFTSTIGALSAAIGDEIARQINAELAAAASTAFLCLRDYVGSTYSNALFGAFQESVRASVASTGTVTFDPDDVNIGIVDTHGGLITGAGIIVVTEVGTRVAARISEKLAERVAGKIIGRVLGRAGSTFIPVAGWVVGIALIVWDLVEGGKGALPQIEEALTSEDVKTRIRSEVADAVRAGLPEEASITSLETAVSMIEEWDRFCGRYPSVCTLAAENASFRALLSELPLGDLERLQMLEDVFLDSLGRGALDQALETGDFDKLLALPPAAGTILADTASVETTLAWADVANDDLAQVAAIGIHRFTQPAEMTRDRLDKLLAWNDGVAARRFLLLDASAREILWPLGGQTLFTVVSLLEEAQIESLAAGLALWPAADRQRIAGDFIAGARTLAEVTAGPTPAPTFALQPSAEPSTPPPAATGSEAGTTDATGSPDAPLTPTATGTSQPPPGPFGNTDPATLGLLGALVLLLAIVAALLLWRRAPKD